MKWWNRFTLLFLALSVGVNVLLVFRLFESRRQAARLAERLRTALTPDQQTLSWERYFASMIAYQDFPQDDIAVRGMDEGSVSLGSLLSGPTLVFRYKSTDCGQCVDFALLKLKKAAAHIGAGRILVLAGQTDRRGMEMLRRQQGMEDIRFYRAETVNTPAETVQYPYCFVLDRDMLIRSVFIPDKANPRSMDLYLKMIGKRYFSDPTAHAAPRS